MNDGRRSDNNDISLEVLANLDIITDIKNATEQLRHSSHQGEELINKIEC